MDDLSGNMTKRDGVSKRLWHGEMACRHAAGTGRGRQADPGMKARLAAIGGETMPGSPADFGKLISDETEKWGKVVRAGGLKPE